MSLASNDQEILRAPSGSVGGSTSRNAVSDVLSDDQLVSLILQFVPHVNLLSDVCRVNRLFCALARAPANFLHGLHFPLAKVHVEDADRLEHGSSADATRRVIDRAFLEFLKRHARPPKLFFRFGSCLPPVADRRDASADAAVAQPSSPVAAPQEDSATAAAWTAETAIDQLTDIMADIEAFEAFGWSGDIFDDPKCQHRLFHRLSKLLSHRLVELRIEGTARIFNAVSFVQSVSSLRSLKTLSIPYTGILLEVHLDHILTALQNLETLRIAPCGSGARPLRVMDPLGPAIVPLLGPRVSTKHTTTTATATVDDAVSLSSIRHLSVCYRNFLVPYKSDEGIDALFSNSAITQMETLFLDKCPRTVLMPHPFRSQDRGSGLGEEDTGSSGIPLTEAGELEDVVDLDPSRAHLHQHSALVGLNMRYQESLSHFIRRQTALHTLYLAFRPETGSFNGLVIQSRSLERLSLHTDGDNTDMRIECPRLERLSLQSNKGLVSIVNPVQALSTISRFALRHPGLTLFDVALTLAQEPLRLLRHATFYIENPRTAITNPVPQEEYNRGVVISHPNLEVLRLQAARTINCAQLVLHCPKANLHVLKEFPLSGYLIVNGQILADAEDIIAEDMRSPPPSSAHPMFPPRGNGVGRG